MATFYWVGGSGNWTDSSSWSTSSGGSGGAGVPDRFDDVIFDANSSGSDFIIDIVSTDARCNNFDSSAVSVEMRIRDSGFVRLIVSGDITTSGNEIIDVNLLIFADSGTKTVNMAGTSIIAAVLFNVNFYGGFQVGSWSVGDIDCGNFTILEGSVDLGSSDIQVSGFDARGGSLNAASATITLKPVLTLPTSFQGNGRTYGTVIVQSDAVIKQSNTIDTVDALPGAEIIFQAGTTQTVNNFDIKGEEGNLIKIRSDTAGTQATLTKSSGIVRCDYLDIKDSNATGGATWYAGANSIDSGGN